MIAQNRLIIGSGIHRREAWKTLDADPARGADFVASIPPFPAEVKAIQWQEIEWIHGITSLYPWDAEQALVEIAAMLAPGGVLILEQPDFRKCIQNLEWVYGDDAGTKNPLNMNHYGYTPYSLTKLLERCGFSTNIVMAAKHHVPARDFRIEARK